MPVHWTPVLLSAHSSVSPAARSLTARLRPSSGANASQLLDTAMLRAGCVTPQTAESEPQAVVRWRQQQPDSKVFTVNHHWPGLAEVLQSALPSIEPLLSKGGRSPVRAFGTFPQGLQSTSPTGGFGDLASARRFVSSAHGGAAALDDEELGPAAPYPVWAPHAATLPGLPGRSSSKPASASSQYTMGGSSSSSTGLRGAVAQPPDQRLVRSELASVWLRRRSRPRPPPTLFAVAVEDSRAPEGMDQLGTRVTADQAEYVTGLFHSCLPRPPDHDTECARQERRRRQLERADKRGVWVAQRIAWRRQQAEVLHAQVGLSETGLTVSGYQTTDGSGAEKEEEAEVAAAETASSSSYGCAADEEPARNAQTPSPHAEGRGRSKRITLKGLLHLQRDRASRLKRLDRMRRVALKKQASFGVAMPKGPPQPPADPNQPAGARTYSRSRLLQPTGDPAQDALQAAFCRYDREDLGKLGIADVRAALYDLGLQPSPRDRKEVMQLVSEAVNDSQSGEGVSFGEFEALIPRIREAIQELRRVELQEWYTKGLDQNGRYDIKNLRACLAAQGMQAIGDEEWKEVLKVVDGFPEAVEGHFGQTRGRAKQKGQALLNRIAVLPQALGETTGDWQFELFEHLVHQAEEKLGAMSRARERGLAEDLKLTREEFDEFREDLLELLAFFKHHAHAESNKLDADAVLNLLTACGCFEVEHRLTKESVIAYIYKVKAMKTDQASPDSRRTPTTVQEDKRGQSVLDTLSEEEEEGEDEEQRLQNGGKKRHQVFVDFLEFLGVLRCVRREARERRRGSLVEHFGRYDLESKGVVSTKDMSKILRDVEMQPHTREEQMEMRRIFDESDANGTGALAFPQFELLVQRMCENAERTVRRDEEHFAMELGFRLPYYRRLRRIFDMHISQGKRLLFIEDLRKVMTLFSRKYTSDELVSLFQAFARQDLGGIDAKGFFRMMHAVEIAKTHGQIND